MENPATFFMSILDTDIEE
jgi:hypothetical protein